MDREYLEELTEYSLTDLKKQMEDITRRLRIHEYDIRVLDKKIQQKEKGFFPKSENCSPEIRSETKTRHTGKAGTPGLSDCAFSPYPMGA